MTCSTYLGIGLILSVAFMFAFIHLFDKELSELEVLTAASCIAVFIVLLWPALIPFALAAYGFSFVARLVRKIYYS